MLAIGIYYDNAFTASIEVDSDNPQICADALAKHNDNGYPDEILLVKSATETFIGQFNSGNPSGHALRADEFLNKDE